MDWVPAANVADARSFPPEIYLLPSLFKKSSLTWFNYSIFFLTGGFELKEILSMSVTF